MYDEETITYQELLDQFFAYQDSKQRPVHVRVKELILPMTPGETILAQRGKEALEASGATFITIKEFEEFYQAQDRYQLTYLLVERGLLQEVILAYGREGFLDQVLAHKMNAYIAGYRQGFIKEKWLLPSGLSTEGLNRLQVIKRKE